MDEQHHVMDCISENMMLTVIINDSNKKNESRKDVVQAFFRMPKTELKCSGEGRIIIQFPSKKELTPPALLNTPRPNQRTLDNYFKAKRARCMHDFVREFPSGPRDNGEYHVCRRCNATRE